MGRKIPLLVDEDVYYVLQELQASQEKEVSDVIRLLFYGAGDVARNNDLAELEHEMKQRLLLEELRAEGLRLQHRHDNVA